MRHPKMEISSAEHSLLQFGILHLECIGGIHDLPQGALCLLNQVLQLV